MNPGVKRFVLIFSLFAALAAPIFAANLYILVAETGGGTEEPSGERRDAEFESSFLWETCLLDVFFETGHVVSNAPALSLDGSEVLDAEFAEARSGGADYVVAALLDYPAAADRQARPERVSLRVYRLEPYRCVYEWTGSLDPDGRNAGALTESETGQAKRLIRGLIPHIEG
ncbi:MAG: hypothetical protein LBF95_01250 [Treponema sp.]|jgi:hypothetical protein|nr:hypothetical protein [Treponema sp.]